MGDYFGYYSSEGGSPLFTKQSHVESHPLDPHTKAAGGAMGDVKRG